MTTKKIQFCFALTFKKPDVVQMHHAFKNARGERNHFSASLKVFVRLSELWELSEFTEVQKVTQITRDATKTYAPLVAFLGPFKALKTAFSKVITHTI